MVKGIYLFGVDDLSDPFKIRKEVFQMEQNIDPLIEFDEYDQEAIHAVIFEEGEIPVGTGRLVYNGFQYKIGRVAVIKEFRGRGYGSFLVNMLLDKAFSMGADDVFIHAQEQVVDFYHRLGFIPFGDIFYEAGIPHKAMKINKEFVVMKNCCCK